MKTATLLALSFLLPRAVAAQTNVGTTVQVHSENKKPHVRLKSGKPIEKELAGGAMDTYEIRVKKGQFLHAIVDQKGIDVALTLYGPDGKQIATMDSPNGDFGLEQVSTIAVANEVLRLEVAGQNSPSRGKYRLSIDVPHLPNDADRARISGERSFLEGSQLMARGDKEALRQAVNKYEASLAFWRLASDRYEEALTLHAMGEIFMGLGETETAFHYLEQALALSRVIEDRDGEACTLSDMGLYYSRIGDQDQTIKILQEAIRLFHDVGDRSVEGVSLSNLGTIYQRAGHFEKALPYYEQALKAEKTLGQKEAEINTLNNMGNLYDTLGDNVRALEYYQQALALNGQQGDRHLQAMLLNNVAEIYLDSGDTQKALDSLNQALILVRELGDRVLEARALSRMGGILATLGKNQQALDISQQALDIKRASRDRRGEAASLSAMGTMLEVLGRPDEAMSDYYAALELARSARDSFLEAAVLGNLMTHWKNSGSPALAILLGKLAINDYQQIRRNIRGMESQIQRSFVKSNEKVYRDLADLLITQGRLPEAQQVLDLLKNEEYFEFIRRDSKAASSLTAPLNLTKDEESVNREYEAKVESITAIANEYDALRAKTDRTPEAEKHLEELSEQVKAANAEFEKFLSQLYTELRKEKSVEDARKEEAHVKEQAFGMQRVVRQLNDQPGHGVVALYTLASQEKYRVIVITSDVVLAREYPITAKELREKVFEFRDLLTHPKSDPVPKAQELYRILVAPVAADLAGAKAETLMWSLDDVLRYLPIAALHDGSDYLVAKYRNEVFTPEYEASLADRPDIASWRGLGMGVSKSYGDFSPLPSVPDELHRIIRDQSVPAAVGVLPGQTMLDDTFTTQNMKKALEQSYPLVHIASHFDYSPGDVTNSFLLLGGKDPQGEHLTLADIRDDPAFNFSDTELLTLSACNTAVSGIAGDGREIDGLGNVAQERGAKAVVASLWGVYDPSTGVLMQEFYKRWTTQKGMPKAEALREAQLTLLHGAQASGNANGKAAAPGSQDSRADFSHPFYWAPFILIGNWK